MYPRTDVNNSESTASSLNYTKVSDAINTIGDDKITSNIHKDVEKVLGPTLERTNSGCDLKITAPLRHKKREYRSQEALPLEESLIASPNQNIINILPSQSEVQINDLHNTNKLKVTRASILHENPRAEIVASVTDRLYSKLKKKEEATVSKMESMVDRKIVEPLSELKICTNARQRLIELSQKAIRNKRKVNVSAQTQTRLSVTRVKDQGIDIQSDLETYSAKNGICYTHMRDASTETLPMTLRCKEIGVGSNYVSLNSSDRSTITDIKESFSKNSCVMTETITTNDCFTQTQVIAPPRRRHRGSKKSSKIDNQNNCLNDVASNPVLSINISQTYPVDSESQSSEDNSTHVSNKNNTGIFTITPDLLTNHTPDSNENEIVQNISNNYSNQTQRFNDNKTIDNLGLGEDREDFSDHEDYSLPRVKPHTTTKSTRSDIKEIILGRNKNLYPYNIVLSPPKQRDDSKRIVTFKDFDYGNKDVLQSSCTDECNVNVPGKLYFTSEEVLSESHFLAGTHHSESMSLIDSGESDKIETDMFIWGKNVPENTPLGCLRRNYVPVYRSSSRKRAGKEHLIDIISSDSSDKSYGPQYISKQKQSSRYLETRKHYLVDSEFDSIERKIFDVCNELELSVNKYNNYIETSINKLNGDKNKMLLKTPTKYLQHLIKIRREMVKMEQVHNNCVFADQQN